MERQRPSLSRSPQSLNTVAFMCSGARVDNNSTNLNSQRHPDVPGRGLRFAGRMTRKTLRESAKKPSSAEALRVDAIHLSNDPQLHWR
jgi:hypothetical protein